MKHRGNDETRSDSNKRKSDWNDEVVVGTMHMLYDGLFYGQVVFTLVNGAVKSMDINQHLKFPSEKPVVISEKEK